MEWAKKKVLVLLDEIEKRPELWDVTHKEYKNKVKRRDTFSELGAIFKCSGSDVEKKFGGLKSQYARELQIAGKSKKSGISTDEVKHSKWFAFNTMCRLRTSNVPKNTISYMTPQTQEFEEVQGRDTNMSESIFVKEEEVEVDVTSEQDVQVNTSCNKRLRNSDKDDTTELFEAASVLKSIWRNRNADKSSELDELMSFGHSIANQLRAIPDLYSRSMAKLKIQQILFEAETGQYQQNSNIPEYT